MIVKPKQGSGSVVDIIVLTIHMFAIIFGLRHLHDQLDIIIFKVH